MTDGSEKIPTFLILITLLVVAASPFAKTSENYCEVECPKPSYRHIGCNVDRRFSRTCVDPKLIPMSTKRKNLFLMMHNRMRNKVASGQLKNFTQASNMSLMAWDDELAYLAELNVKQCVMKHDECRSTASFKYAGQNLARRFSYPKLSTWNAELKRMIKGWYKEHVDASMKYIREYQSHEKGKVIGHFTAVVRDASTHVGCAISVYKKTIFSKEHNKHFTGPEILLACNYANTNLRNKPIYIEGKPCSECPGKCHSVYRSLCDYRNNNS